MSVTVRYWAAARDAAGRDEESVDGVGTLAALLAALRSRHGGESGRLAAVLGVSSYLVDEAPVGARAHDEVLLAEGVAVDVLPPFAGG